MRILYIDESGCTGVLPTATSPIQPVFVLGGFALHDAQVERFTREFLHLKQRFFPGRIPPSGEFLDWIKVEIKGGDIRKDARSSKRDERRAALGFLDKVLDLLEAYGVTIFGRIFIKGIGQPFNGTAVYGSAVQYLATDFQAYLEWQEDFGVMIFDSRNKFKNSNMSHGIFTQRFKASGDAYDRLLEMPLFGHSDNHAGIQAADLLCSGFLFPMAVYAFCQGHIHNIHVDLRYHAIRDKFGLRLRHLQHRYQTDPDHWRGGITVSDALNHQFQAVLFAPAR